MYGVIKILSHVAHYSAFLGWSINLTLMRDDIIPGASKVHTTMAYNFMSRGCPCLRHCFIYR